MKTGPQIRNDLKELGIGDQETLGKVTAYCVKMRNVGFGAGCASAPSESAAPAAVPLPDRDAFLSLVAGLWMQVTKRPELCIIKIGPLLFRDGSVQLQATLQLCNPFEHYLVSMPMPEKWDNWEGVVKMFIDHIDRELEQTGYKIDRLPELSSSGNFQFTRNDFQ